MIPFFRSAGIAGNTADSHVFVGVPSGMSPGDTVIAVVAVSSGTATVTTPAGWTQIRVITSGGFRITVLRRVAGASEGGLYRFDLSASVPVSAIAVAYGNVYTVTPVEVDGAATATSATATAPSVTTLGDQRMVVTITGVAADTSVSTPGGTTSRTTMGGGPSVRLSDFVQAAAGATGAKTSALGASGNNIGYQLALKPPPPPNAPTLTAPPVGAVTDRTSTQRFSWSFSDAVVGESQSQFDLRYRVTGTTTWTTITAATPNQFLDTAGGTFPAATYEWQVRTYDSHGQVGPWSSSAFFSATDPPDGPVITGPVSDQVISHTPTTVVWSAPDQASYQLRRVADAGGSADPATIYFDTGEVTDGTSRTVNVDFPVNARTEHIQLRVRDSHGFLSPWADVRISTSYDLPPPPTIALVGDDGAAAIVVYVDNRPSVGAEVRTAANDIFRRVGSAGAGVRVAAGVPTNTPWTDRTPASGVDYAYQVVAVGTNGLGAASPWSDVRADPLHHPDPELYPSLSNFPGE